MIREREVTVVMMLLLETESSCEFELRRAALLLDKGGHGVVELEEGLHVDGQAGLPVVGERVKDQPGEGVVALQHIPIDTEMIKGR